MQRRWLITMGMLLCLLMTGCSAEIREIPYTQIDQQTAMNMMAMDDGHVIVDVRRQDEYDAGHIPGAILIPNESIGNARPEALPDLEQVILVYCRSGNRSKQAAQKLGSMGYTRVYEFGGIITWPGKVVTTEEEAKEKPMRIRVSDGEHTVIYELNGSPSSRSLYGMLPLEAEVEDYGSNEKIFYPEQEVSTEDGIEGGGTAGGLALFSPWGNVVMYYDSFGAYPGLYLLGQASEGAELVGSLHGTIRVEAAE